jgi:hypothetical protein
VLGPVHRGILNAHSYVRNSDIHRDVCLRMVTDENNWAAEEHEDRLQQHTNVEAIKLLDTENQTFRTSVVRISAISGTGATTMRSRL